jgi:hypothetical protein
MGLNDLSEELCGNCDRKGMNHGRRPLVIVDLFRCSYHMNEVRRWSLIKSLHNTDESTGLIYPACRG